MIRSTVKWFLMSLGPRIAIGFLLLLFTVVVSGCNLTNTAIDRVGVESRKFYDGICDTPANRKLAGAVLLNGALMKQGGAVLVCCPDDKREVCRSARRYYTELFRRAGL